MSTTHWKKVFNSEYLGTCDLEDNKDIKAVIKSVSIRKVKGSDGKEQERNVATFTDPKLKPMILNATNCKIIKKFANTPFIEGWAGVPIQIYVKDDIRAFGDVTEGLRIREYQPQVSKPKLTPESQNWTKAVEFLAKGGLIDEVRKRYELTPEDESLLLTAAV